MKIAESLFEQYRKECGMDDDDVKAARWYKGGLIEFADWLLSQKAEQNNITNSLLVEQIAFKEFNNADDDGLFPNHSDKDIWVKGFVAGFEYDKNKTLIINTIAV